MADWKKAAAIAMGILLIETEGWKVSTDFQESALSDKNHKTILYVCHISEV